MGEYDGHPRASQCLVGGGIGLVRQHLVEHHHRDDAAIVRGDDRVAQAGGVQIEHRDERGAACAILGSDRFGAQAIFRAHPGLNFGAGGIGRAFIVTRADDLVELGLVTTGEIARRSRGTPRLANNRLRWVRDYVTSRADGRISFQLTCDALQMQGIDHAGLDLQDRKYLETVFKNYQGKPVGVESIAATMTVPTDTLVDEVDIGQIGVPVQDNAKTHVEHAGKAGVELRSDDV